MIFEPSIQHTDLVGARVAFPIHGGGRDDGVVRAVYLSRNGYPMLLVQTHDGALVVVSHDSARVRE